MKFNQVACQEVGAMEFSVDPEGNEICLYDFSQTSDYRDQRVYLNVDAARALHAWLDTVLPAQETGRDEEAGRAAYNAHVESAGIHSNRFPSWGELMESDRDEWIKRAAANR